MKRRLFTTIIVALAAILCAFVFVACGGDNPTTTVGGTGNDPVDNHPDDTAYTGALSTETYTSPELAAMAFINVEISGDVTDATFVSYTKTADLTDEEVDALDISAEEKADIASVEKGEVKYTVASGESDLTVRTSADEEKSYFVIIVTYNDQTVKYYSPVINTGDPLTKSYYDKIFAAENFDNVTIKYNMDIPVTVNVQGIEVTTTTTVTLEAKWNDSTYGYYKGTTSIDFLGGISSPISVIEYFYVNNQASPLYHYMFTRTTENGVTGEWELEGTPQGHARAAVNSAVDDSNDVITKFMPPFDYSYFIKTKTGFKINSEKLTEYLNIALKDAFETAGTQTMGLKLEDKTTATADYYVSDGKITESVVKVTCYYTVEVDGVSANCVMKETITTEYTDYGTTVVTVPSGLNLNSYL